MKHTLLLFILSLCGNILTAQYDSECFVTTKKEIKILLEKGLAEPGDSIRFQDTIVINGVRRYVDTMFLVRNFDAGPFVTKIVGCRMPDFSFFNLNKDELSVNKISTDYTIISFSSTSYGDVCNARLNQYCRLKKLLQDSLTVLNIFEEEDAKVSEYSKSYEDNVEFIANADLITYNYSLNTGATIFLLDKYKNIIYVKTGQRYNYTPDEIYSELLEIMRSTTCSD